MPNHKQTTRRVRYYTDRHATCIDRYEHADRLEVVGSSIRIQLDQKPCEFWADKIYMPNHKQTIRRVRHYDNKRGTYIDRYENACGWRLLGLKLIYSLGSHALRVIGPIKYMCPITSKQTKLRVRHYTSRHATCINRYEHADRLEAGGCWIINKYVQTEI